ncbi:MAG: hypothetical protein WA112_09000, partial [Rugosibacter sp.]
MFRFPYTPRLLSPASSKNPPILSIRCINFQSLRCVNLQVLVTEQNGGAVVAAGERQCRRGSERNWSVGADIGTVA